MSIEEATALFFPGGDFSSSPAVGGVNNICSYIDYAGRTHFLKIYNNGNNTARVRFEHKVLRELQKIPLSFKTPKPVCTSGCCETTHVALSSGAEACCFELIPGTLPSSKSLDVTYAIGKAAGELNTALAQIEIADIAGCAPPIYDLYATHHAVTRALFFETVSSSRYEACRGAMDFLVESIGRMETRLIELHEMGLVKQLIHGDLHYDNVLVEGEEVTGILDFEFCARDWRGMELAICLTKYSGEEEPLPLFEAFCRGFMTSGVLSDAEISVIPDLLELRILNNVVYFTGRAIAGEDTEYLVGRAPVYEKRVRWIRRHAADIVSIINKK